MRRVQVTVVTRDGVSVDTHDVPDATFAERMTDMLVAAPSGEVTAAVRCDGCGRTEPVDPVRPALPPGWVESEIGELCPKCR